MAVVVVGWRLAGHWVVTRRALACHGWIVGWAREGGQADGMRGRCLLYCLVSLINPASRP